IKCSKDPVYFAKNYIKIISVDDGVVPFKMYKFQETLIKRFHKHRFNICKLPRQSGKMLSLDTPIPTPEGWTTMGELKVGETIFGRDGKTTKVLGKSPIQKIDTYEIEFDNGEIIKACSEHLWKISHSDWNHKEKVLNTKEILEKFNRLKKIIKPSSVYIKINESINLPEVNLPIDPYTLGVWLGDGSRNNGTITGLYEDIEIISSNIPLKITNKYKDKRKNDVWRYSYENLRKETHILGLNIQKFIPENYLRSSTLQRLQLLRGLMDTDGSVSPNGACEFYQKDGKLLYQVRELLSSLGIKSRIRYKKIPGYSDLYGTISFCTQIYEVFTLPRKLERQRNSLDHPKNKRLYIKDIRKIETEPMQCIAVDSEDHLFLCGKTFIPTHNSTTAVSYLLHYAIFNDSVNIAILANKAQTAKDLLARLQLAYENLPKWLQQGVKIWNKASLELDNGSKIIAASTSASSVRGGTYNIIFLDEFAFIANNIAEEFFRSTYPTITSGKNTKVIVVSTPNGMNMYYKLWTEAERKLNEYVTTEVHWSEVPGRDQKFKEQTIANTGIDSWNQEFECSFLGSAGTLISAAKINTLIYDKPISRSNGLDIYKQPEKDHLYLIIVDCSEGVGKDYHAFIVFDITSIPYTIVTKYKNNELKPMLLADVIKSTATAYNDAYILIEIASVGEQVAKNIHYDLEYGNLLMSSVNGRAGQVIGQGLYGRNSQYGLKISKQVKRVGCSNLKTIIEDDKVLIRDFEIISELTTFIAKNNSYEAEIGCNDDLVSCLVIFAWLVVQDYFKDLTNNDIRKKISEEQKEQLDLELAPLGFFDDGMDENEQIIDKETGDVWLVVDKHRNSIYETFDFDPYSGSYNNW
ncbi:MAG: terminase family protein, partial [Candidatus Lokiarchaeota archaeon]|nr:terminase family protein [Candidatus Lokiarchaeota archaeon]